MVSRRGLALGLSLLAGIAGAQMLSWKANNSAASEQFRLGVIAYNKGLVNESIASLERALSAVPADPLVSSWLAKAYGRSGFAETALTFYNEVLDQGYASPFVLSRIESIEAARLTLSDSRQSRFAGSLIEMGRLSKSTAKNSKPNFLRPSWIEPLAGGNFLLCVYGQDRILEIDVNGQVRKTIVGPLGGLDRPFCAIVAADGRLYVSESGADRVSIMDGGGKLLKRFGSHGRGPGQFYGPQYMCFDSEGFLYVCDYGNQRIQKFDQEGNYLLSFGQAQTLAMGFGYVGLGRPAGLAAMGGEIIVADAKTKSLELFDLNGNHLSSIAAIGLLSPEGLRFDEYGDLLIADQDKIKSLHIEDESIETVFSSGDPNAKLLCAATEANGAVLACDFDNSLVLFLRQAESVYSGFRLDALRVNADRFPSVEIELMVRDRDGRPIEGLLEKNFYLSEQITKVEQRLEGKREVGIRLESAVSVQGLELLKAKAEEGRLDSIALVDGSAQTRQDILGSKDLCLNLMASLAGTDFAGIVEARSQPEYRGRAEPASWLRDYLDRPSDSDWNFDLALRLAASKLLQGGKKRSLFLVTSGALGDLALKSYSLAEIKNFLWQNNIRLICVLTGRRQPDAALEYLTRETRGFSFPIGHSKGNAELIRLASKAESGVYYLRFKSQAEDDFGRGYIPLSVEAYLMKQSGREETGYFAPLR